MRGLLMSLLGLLVNSRYLHVSYAIYSCGLLVNFAFTREFAPFTREFTPFTREFARLLVNSPFTREFAHLLVIHYLLVSLYLLVNSLFTRELRIYS